MKNQRATGVLERLGLSVVAAGALVVAGAPIAVPQWTGSVAMAQDEEREMPEPEVDDIVEMLTEELGLDEEQQAGVGEAIGAYMLGLNETMAKHEAAEEPDGQKMIGDIKKVRGSYHAELEKVLSKDQFEAYKKLVDETQREMMNEIAAIRLLDMKEPLELTDEQIDELSPIMGESLLKTIRLVFANADKKLRMPQKVKLGRELKEIQADLQSSVKGVLSEEQMQKYQAYREAQQ